MHLDFTTLDSLAAYRIMVQTIVPRPIAWVLTENHDGKSYNIAPFSYFNIVTDEPPLLSLSIGRKNDNTVKDTRANIESRREFVIHITNSAQAASITQSSAALPYGVSEVDALGLQLVYDLPHKTLPRVAGTRVAYVCRFEQMLTVGVDEHALIIVRILSAFIDDKIIHKQSDDLSKLRVDANLLDPLGRLGGNLYATLGKVIDIPRPEYRP